MDAIEAILSRRSVRSYEDREVGKAEEETLLRAAMAAPSAGNEQPWHIVVVRDAGKMRKIAEVHPHAAMLKQAKLCIVLVGEKALELHQGMMVQDLSAAAENLLLAAHAMGLGAVWCGVHPRPEREVGVAQILGIPEGMICFCVIPIGYPKVKPERVDRFSPERVHRETW